MRNLVYTFKGTQRSPALPRAVRPDFLGSGDARMSKMAIAALPRDFFGRDSGGIILPFDSKP